MAALAVTDRVTVTVPAAQVTEPRSSHEDRDCRRDPQADRAVGAWLTAALGPWPQPRLASG